MPLTVGTAGHVDHGKTWLVRALTGKDTDRLPEERARAMSIDLGYAPLDLGGGRRVSLVDVPGHERFVRNMVAGATGIDLFLLVVDAREGPRPQTHEHVRILRLLGISTGVVAVTKTDAVDGQRLAAALDEARELVDGVGGRCGEREDRVRAGGATRCDRTRSRSDPAAGVRGSDPAVRGPRLHAPRDRDNRDGNTVVGVNRARRRARCGARRSAYPRPERPGARRGGRPCRGRPARRRGASASLPGELSRGTALVEPGAYAVTYRLDVALEELVRVPAQVTAHHGSAATSARLRRRDGVARLQLAEPLVTAPGDRVLLRAETTVGAGVVLERAAPVAVAPPAAPPVPRPAPLDDGRVRLRDGLVLDRAELERARELVIAECEREGTITLARARDVLGTSRKLAQAILERLDSDRVTLRVGDSRRLRRR